MENFLNDQENCPNIGEELKIALTGIGTAVNARICDEAKNAKDYTDAEILVIKTDLQSKIDGLTTDVTNLVNQDTLDKINALKTLVETLDTDNDGSIVDTLLEIKTVADSALEVANEAKTIAESAKTTSESALTESNSAKSIANTAQAKANENASDLVTVKSDIESLKSNTNTSVGLTVGEVTEIAEAKVCELAKNIKTGLDAGVTAFMTELNKSCTVESSSSTDTGGIG